MAAPERGPYQGVRCLAAHGQARLPVRQLHRHEPRYTLTHSMSGPEPYVPRRSSPPNGRGDNETGASHYMCVTTSGDVRPLLLDEDSSIARRSLTADTGVREYCLSHCQHDSPPRPPEVVSCSIQGCEKTMQARGWCSTHYARWRRHGDPLKLLRRPNNSTQLCQVPGCQRRAVLATASFCRMHLTRVQKHGDPGPPEPQIASPADPVCEVEGCGHPRERRSWCAAHYRRVLAYGHPGPARIIRRSREVETSSVTGSHH